MNDKGFRIEIPVNIKRWAPKVAQQESPRDNEHGDVPRIALLLALAHKWEGMVRRGKVKGYSHLAKQTGLTRARIAQICNLVLIVPELQEALLLGRRDLLSSRGLRRTVRRALWSEQGDAAFHHRCSSSRNSR